MNMKPNLLHIENKTPKELTRMEKAYGSNRKVITPNPKKQHWVNRLTPFGLLLLMLGISNALACAIWLLLQM